MFLFQKPIFGLDISDYSIEVISLGGSLENPKLLVLGRTVLEAGIVEDGKILKKETLKEALRKLIEHPKFGKIKTKKLIFSLPESKSFVHILGLPKDLKEKSEFIKSQASQTFPLSLKDLYFDFRIQNGEALLIAVPKSIVEGYLQIYKDLKLTPVALEIESLSLARALIPDTKKTTLIADIGARTTNFSLFDEKGLRLSITIEIAGNKFTQAISEELKVTSKEAESLKRKTGLNARLKKGRVFLILQKEIQAIIREIKKIEDYFKKKEGKSIEKIILAGGSVILPHFSNYFSENLEIPILIADPWLSINIDILKKKEYFQEALEVNPVFYSTVIGSALRGLEKNPKSGINLIKQ